MPVISLLRRKQNKETETLLKTENMKTTMKQLAAGTFIALLLLVGNVNAKGTETIASGHESTESSLQIEKWMTNEFLWNSNSVNISEFVLETETTIEIESWMTNLEIWTPVAGLIEETESALQLESWMISEASLILVSNESDTELTVESWMTEKNIL